MRGNRIPPGGSLFYERSIPACAGEPCARPWLRGPRTVYPRVCGGTGDFYLENLCQLGLSPRVRGNQYVCATCARRRGSIPACAGEPLRMRDVCAWARAIYVFHGGTPDMRDVCAWARVYPRVCGGTQQQAELRRQPEGLSPRVRGNQHQVGCPVKSERSIPACAWKPLAGLNGWTRVTVYPRVCGGTLFNLGNVWSAARSIPACAGEPLIYGGNASLVRVYPRVCGGTMSMTMSFMPRTGLSPRVRGNLPTNHCHDPELGSIPACAGEPPPKHTTNSPPTVYPRVCGGTRPRTRGLPGLTGLSPRVRGNR